MPKIDHHTPDPDRPPRKVGNFGRYNCLVDLWLAVLKPVELSVFLIHLRYCDATTGLCWPGMWDLAKKTGMRLDLSPAQAHREQERLKNRKTRGIMFPDDETGAEAGMRMLNQNSARELAKARQSLVSYGLLVPYRKATPGRAPTFRVPTYSEMTAEFVKRWPDSAGGDPFLRMGENSPPLMGEKPPRRMGEKPGARQSNDQTNDQTTTTTPSHLRRKCGGGGGEADESFRAEASEFLLKQEGYKETSHLSKILDIVMAGEGAIEERRTAFRQLVAQIRTGVKEHERSSGKRGTTWAISLHVFKRDFAKALAARMAALRRPQPSRAGGADQTAAALASVNTSTEIFPKAAALAEADKAQEEARQKTIAENRAKLLGNGAAKSASKGSSVANQWKADFDQGKRPPPPPSNFRQIPTPPANPQS